MSNVIAVARYGRFGIQIQPQMEEAYASGTRRVTQRGIYAEFVPGGLSAEEREFAITHFQFLGGYQEMDEATPVQPDYRIGRFDLNQQAASKGWNDEERELVAAELRRLSGSNEDFYVIPAVELEPPWPTYDRYRGNVQSLVKKVAEDGYDVPAVIAYEREHRNREDVLTALEALQSDAEPLREDDLEVVG